MNLKKYVKKIAYTLLKLYCRKKTIRMNLSEAYNNLRKFNNDVQSSCYVEKIIENGCKYDLDIIIPAYNVENYIEECLNSVINQKSKYSYRVIVINDGSTDNTLKIINSYKKYKNVKIISQNNTGFSGARNSGLKCINSEYVMFVDSDDTIPDGAIDKLLDAAFSKKYDIVYGGINYTDTNGKCIDKLVTVLGETSKTAIHGFACGKIIKSTHFQNLKFPMGYWYEDSIMRQILYEKVKTVFSIKDMVYNYRQNPSSISRTGRFKPKSVDSLWITMQLYNDRKKFKIKDNLDYYNYLMKMACLTYKRTQNMPEEIKKYIFIIYSDFIRKFGTRFKCDKKYNDLRRALNDGNYNLYKLFCTYY